MIEGRSSFVVVAREFGTSINVSAKLALKAAIERYGVGDLFDIQDRQIVGRNGLDALIWFRGIERNREEIRGWESVDDFWGEEAQRFTHATANVLIPTLRKPGVERWFTWNPTSRTDWIWQRFVERPRPTDVSALVNWRDNPWFPPEANIERLDTLKNQPEMYPHMWEGEPDEEGTVRRVLPYRLLALCVEAYREYATQGFGAMPNMGLDIADTGGNFSALCQREGPIIRHAEKWQSVIIGDTARRADHHAREHGVQQIFYDAGGMGAGVRSYFREMQGRPYSVRPEMFGGAVKGPETTFSYRITNKDFFANRSVQMGWTLRLRAERTRRLMNGEDVPLMECLFIDPSMPNLEEFMGQLAQPTWKTNEVNGKTELDKRDDDEPSPDLYDAAILSFAGDSFNGLRAR